MAEQLSFQIDGGGSIPTSPLQMRVEKIDVISACILNKKWHSRLPIIDWSNVTRNIHYVCYGSKYEYNWFAVAIWSTPVAANRFINGNKYLELRRMAISDNSPKFTASWMIGIMVKLIKKQFPDVIKLISYQDTDVHNGTIYKASGWNQNHITKGIDWSTNKRKRNKCQTMSDKIRWELELY